VSEPLSVAHPARPSRAAAERATNFEAFFMLITVLSYASGHRCPALALKVLLH
jgi:hypothetical protein